MRPQTKFWNKMQLDWIWTYLQEIKLRIWEEKFDILIKMSENKTLKNKAIEEQSNRMFWVNKREYWKNERKKEKYLQFKIK